MPRCELTGKAPVAKNLVSHSNIKTKSRALPNIQPKGFFSLHLKEFVRLKVAASAIRNIDKAGGFDVFLMKQSDSCLSPRALKVKKRILKKMRRPAGAAKKDKASGSKAAGKQERSG